MAQVTYKGQQINLLTGETVLEALLREGIDAPYGCQSGSCQTCIQQSDSPDIPEYAQESLKENLQKQGYFLPCICHPDTDMVINDKPPEGLFQPVQVLAKEAFNSQVCRVKLSIPPNFHYEPGQFINLRRSDGVSRSYSLCSHPLLDSHLEIHIQRQDNGDFSNWVHDQLTTETPVELYGPQGHCSYVSPPARDMLLIGTGTGIAPLYGIIRDALQRNHSGKIFLFYGSRHLDGLYLLDELQELADKTENLSLTACLSGDDNTDTGIEQGRANDIAFSRHNNLGDCDIYLCGHPAMVKSSQQQAYLAGAALKRIFIDPFDHKDLRDQPR